MQIGRIVFFRFVIFASLFSAAVFGRAATPAPEDEPVYPPQFRPPLNAPLPPLGAVITVNWRFRVPDGEAISFDIEPVRRQILLEGRDHIEVTLSKAAKIKDFETSHARAFAYLVRRG